MKWITLLLATVKEYLAFRNKTPQKEIAEREAEKTQTKGIKQDINQTRLSKKRMRRIDKWYNQAVKRGYVKEGTDKMQAWEENIKKRHS